MPWVKIDDMFSRHPKVMQAGPLGMALHIAGLCYCSQYLTDGFIPNAVTNTLLDLSGLAFTSTPSPDAAAGFSNMDDAETWMVVQLLVKAGMWEPADGGFQIHDYLVYNYSRAQILTERAANAERQKRHKQRVNHAVTDADGNGMNNGVTNAAPIPIPIPKELTPHSPPVGDDAEIPRAKRGARIPPEFQVNEDMYLWAESKGVTRAEADRETEQFILYWQGETGRHAVKLDWTKTWQTRILDQIQMGKIGPARRNGMRPSSLRPLQADHNAANQRNADGTLKAVY